MTPELRYLDLLDAAARTLAEAGVEGPRRDARRLLEAAAVSTAAELVAVETDAAPTDLSGRYESMIARRAAGEPVSRILGRRAFYGRIFKVTPAVLDPRPDTEIVIEQALSMTARADARILELGVGSGCILGTLLAERPGWTGIGVDVSPDALLVARDNLAGIGVLFRAELRRSDWFSAVGTDALFDLIISNPPYISEAELSCLSREVREFDPMLALDGGLDGLAAFRLIAKGASSRLMSGGGLVFEIGAKQAEDVASILEMTGSFTAIGICKDLSGTKRCVYGRRS